MSGKKILQIVTIYFFCLLASYFLIYIATSNSFQVFPFTETSINETKFPGRSIIINNWLYIWKFIPAMTIPFADITHIAQSVLSKSEGFDPFLYNPHGITQATYQYPSIWLYIFDFLKLTDKTNFNFFLIFSISFYLFALSNLFLISKGYVTKIILLILFLSTSNQIVIERGNIDHIIFYLIFLIAIFSNLYIGMLIAFFCSIAKVYPLFAFLTFLKDKKKVFLSYLLIVVAIFILYQDNIIIPPEGHQRWWAIIPAYGSGSISEAIFHLLKDHGIIEFSHERKNIIRLAFALLFIAIAFFSFLSGQKNEIKLNINSQILRLFTIGSSIYVGTYAIASNLDHRLIFLFFTIPYMLKKNDMLSIIFTICVLISTNSWYFASGEPLSAIYAVKATFVYSAKLIVFLILSYELGRINKNFFYDIFFRKAS